MFNYFKFQLKKLFDYLEELKGTRTLKYVTTYRHDDANYKIVTNNDFIITIYCIEHIYRCEYSSPLIKDKDLSVFHIYSICSEDTPDLLKQKLKNELKISPIASYWATREYHKKAAIQAYIDLVINDLHQNFVN